MNTQCTQCSKTFSVSEQLQQAVDQFVMPVGKCCFECMQKQHLLFSGEWSLRKRTCDSSGKQIVSIYSEDAPFPVYDPAVWSSDEWDPLEYGREIDFARPFFEQYRELQSVVPRAALMNINAENSDYCHSSYGNKNCYLIFGGDLNENALYGQLSMRNRDIMDCDYTNDSELCYMSSDVSNCYGCWFAFNSQNCRDSYFINDCSGVSECILSVNLRNVSHYILNEPYTKAEYEKKKAEIFNGSYDNLQKYITEYKKLLSKRVVKYAHNVNAHDSTGDYITSSNRCINCFDVSDCDQLENIIFGTKAKDCFNSTLLGHGAERVFNSISTYQSTNIRCSSFVIDSYNVDYSEIVMNSHDIFGSIGLRKESFVILNKKYSEEEYKILVQRITEHMKKMGEWGDFFRVDLAPFAYNESAAQSYFPLSKEVAVQAGYAWNDEVVQSVSNAVVNELPDMLEDMNENHWSQPITCIDCSITFKIMSIERSMYEKMSMPVARKCPRCRFQ